MDIDKLGQIELKQAITGETVFLRDVWKEQGCVIYFVRRFGCPLCVHYLQKLSAHRTDLHAQNYKLVTIGHENGVEKFLNNDFTKDIEVYLDNAKATYNQLGFIRMSPFSLLGSALSQEGRVKASEAKKDNAHGDFSGDLRQNGGLLIITPGGSEVLEHFVQLKHSQHVPEDEVLKIVGVTTSAGKEDPSDSGPTVCIV